MSSLRAFPPSGNPDGSNGHALQLSVRALSRAPKPAPLSYLLAERVSFGTLTGLQGDPGLGKSLLLAALAAAASGAIKLPGTRRRRRHGKALILTREEDEARDLLPRVQAAGGDPELVLSLTGDGKRLPWNWTPFEALDHFEALIRDEGIRFVAFDPITSWMPSGMNIGDERQVRPCLEDLAGIAMRTGAAVVSLRHLRKVRSANVVDPGIGSIAFFAVPRCVLVCDALGDRPGVYGLEVLKANFQAKPPALLYRIEDAGGVGRIRFDGEEDLAGRQLGGVQLDAGERDAREEARELLRSMLANGPMSSKSLKVKALDAMLSDSTLRRAKADLGIVSRRVGFGDGSHTEWVLPAAAKRK